MEPERPIEKLLRAYANKRRSDAGDPMELHPADRRILQAEIARRTRERPAAGLFQTWFATWRSQIALVSGALMVIALGLWAFLPTHRRTEPEQSATESAPASLPMTPQENQTKETQELVDYDDASSQAATGQVAPAALAARQASAPQRFLRVQTPPTQPARPAAPAIDHALLTSFEVARDGDQIRIIDADGSVYTGSLQIPDLGGTIAQENRAVPATAVVTTVTAAGAVESSTPAVSAYSFAVSGTNRSLNQSIVFTGAILTNTNGASPKIFGRAILDSRAFDIEATPVER